MPGLAANTSEILFLTHLYQEITGLVRLTYSPSRKSKYWEVYYFYSSISLPKDHLRKRGRTAKSALFAELILPAYIYSDRTLCLDTQSFTQNAAISEGKQQGREGKQIISAVSAAELNEFPKILNPWIKVLMETSLPKTFREAKRVMTKWLQTQGAQS